MLRPLRERGEGDEVYEAGDMRDRAEVWEHGLRDSSVFGTPAYLKLTKFTRISLKFENYIHSHNHNYNRTSLEVLLIQL